MSRFCAELIITLDDGKTVIEGFNQAEMAQFTQQRMLGRLHDGLPLIHFDGERIEIPPERVADVNVVVHDLIPA